NCLFCRRWLRAAVPLALLGLAAVSLAQQPIPAPAVPSPASAEALAQDKMIIAEGKAHSEIMANLGHLSDVIGPRLTGSAALKRANEWAAEKMKSYGLTNVKLEPYSTPAGWERGTATARIVEPNNGRSLLIPSMGWTPGT